MAALLLTTSGITRNSKSTNVAMIKSEKKIQSDRNVGKETIAAPAA
jgi:hypothetical protein